MNYNRGNHSIEYEGCDFVEYVPSDDRVAQILEKVDLELSQAILSGIKTITDD